MRELVLCLVIILAVLAAPAVASAHAVLASSQPQAGQRLGTAPGVVVLEFTEPVNPRLSTATVTDPTGGRFTGGVSEGQEIRVPLSTNASGVYTVDWVSVSTLDGLKGTETLITPASCPFTNRSLYGPRRVAGA